ncbi:hypothetical protein PMAYCL1PPCAC_24230, partial [Pristionchus mayeri]
MAPIISHVFIGGRLIIEKVRLHVDPPMQQMKFVELNGNEHIFNMMDMDRLDFCFHESGTMNSSHFEAVAVLRFSDSQLLDGVTFTPDEPVVLIFGAAYKDFLAVQKLVVMYQRLLSPKRVKLLPFSQFPDCVKAVIPQIAQYFSRDLEKRIAKANVPVKEKEKTRDDCIAVSSDEEDESASSFRPNYYLIENERIQITPDGIKSLSNGVYVNDEIINNAFKRLINKHPLVHFFDTFTTSKLLHMFEQKKYEDNLLAPVTEKEFNRLF